MQTVASYHELVLQGTEFIIVCLPFFIPPIQQTFPLILQITEAYTLCQSVEDWKTRTGHSLSSLTLSAKRVTSVLSDAHL